MRLKDKVALVTGAGRGIGKGISLRLAEEGARVVINDINAERGEETVGQLRELRSESAFIEADVSDWGQVKQMVKRVVDQFNKIDILVNNVGITRVRSVEEMTVEEWDETFAINLRSAFLVSKATIGPMKGQDFGRIINISSQAGMTGGVSVGIRVPADYAASKAGVIAFTWVLAQELAPFNITVNTIAPGPTPAVPSAPERQRKSGSTFVDRIPLGRFGRPEDIAGAVVFLASEDADYVTGATIVVNGGLVMG